MRTSVSVGSKATVLGIAVVVGFLSFPAEAQYFSFGQFHAYRADSANFEQVINPTGVEMYSMRIGYGPDGAFLGCEGELIAPHANLTDSFAVGIGSADIVEMLSVPSTAESSAGQINKRFGVAPYQAEKTVHALNPAVFEFDDTEGPTSVEDCVCAELCTDTQDTDLLDEFGFDCDPC